MGLFSLKIYLAWWLPRPSCCRFPASCLAIAAVFVMPLVLRHVGIGNAGLAL